MYEAGLWGMLDDGSDPLVWSSALMLNVIALLQATGKRCGDIPWDL